MLSCLLSGVLCLLAGVSASPLNYTWTSNPFNPLSIPLAVRSPYLSTWLPGGNNGGYLPGQWPQFWTGQITGWAGYVMVDNVTYIWMGDPVATTSIPPLAVQVDFQLTSTQSKFALKTGGVTLNVTFLSPIPTNDLTQLSIPFSYLAVSASSNDGNSHDVSLYTDISGEWVFSNTSMTVNWTTTADSSSTIHAVGLTEQLIYGEVEDRAAYGNVYYAAQAGGTYMVAQDVLARNQFITYGILPNTLDTDFRPISPDWPVFAHAFDLGTVTSAPTTSVVFAIGHVRDPAIQYIVATAATIPLRNYFFSQYGTVQAVIDDFIGNYSAALSTANSYDSQVVSDASKVSSDYVDIVVTAARQTFGGTELVYGTSSSDIMMFIKEISSDGNINTVDVIHPTHPIFIYTNPTLLRYMVEPLLAYQATGQYPNKWSVHDMGSSYPNATGHNSGNDEQMPIEESGNMLILQAAYLKATNDTSQAVQYYGLYRQWADYLVGSTLVPGNQLSSDDLAGPLANQTNLAIKGVVGLGAFSQIAAAVGNYTDNQIYMAIAQALAQQVLALGMSSDGSHLTLTYGNDSSWAMEYNLYADKMLGMGIFSQSVYDLMSSWYTRVANPFGVPLDTRNIWTVLYWEAFCSLIASTTSVRDLFIDAIANYQTAGLTSSPEPDVVNTLTGAPVAFLARPILGAHYIWLALAKMGTTVVQATQTLSAGPTATTSGTGLPNSSPSSSNGGPTSSVTSYTSFSVLMGIVLVLLLSQT